MLRVDGSLFFGAIDNVMTLLDEKLEGFEGHLILDLSGVTLSDMAGADLLVSTARQMEQRKLTLHLCNLKKSVRRYMKKGNYQKLLRGTIIHRDEVRALRQILIDLDETTLSPEELILVNKHKTLVGLN